MLCALEWLTSLAGLAFVANGQQKQLASQRQVSEIRGKQRVNCGGPMLRTACYGLVLIALCGCVNAPPVEFPETVVNRPALNRSETAELGATVLEKGKYRLADALISTNDIAFECGVFKARWTMPAGILIARQGDANSTYYFSSGTIMHDAIYGDILSPRMAALNVKKGNMSDFQAILLPSGITCSLLSAPVLKSTQVPSSTRPVSEENSFTEDDLAIC